MGLPIFEETRERIVNSAELNIANAKYEAIRVLAEALPSEEEARVWAEDMELVSYNSIRNNYVAMFTNWKYPDRFVTVQFSEGSYYTHVSKNILRDSNHSQLVLPGL